MIRDLPYPFVGIMIVLSSLSCSTNKKSVSQANAAATQTQPNASTTTASNTIPTSVMTATSTVAQTNPCVKPFALQGTDTYADASEVFADFCVGCHNSSDAPGGDFSSPQVVKDLAQKIKARIHLTSDDAALMPPGNKLSDEDLATIDAWIDAGTPLPSSEDNGSNPTPTSTSTDSKDPLPKPIDLDSCGKPITNGSNTMTSDEENNEDPANGDADGSDSDADSTSTNSNASTSTNTNSGTSTSTGSNNTGYSDPNDPIPEGLLPYINPEAKNLCHDNGSPFFRKADAANPYGRCDALASYPAPFPCTYEGALAAFNNNPTVKKYLDKKKAEGWYYDDCGVLNNYPVVYFACFTKGDGVCVKIKDLTPARLKILGERLTLGL